MSDTAPWEDYQQPADQGPWSEYAAPVPQGGVMGALKGASRALEANLPFVDRAVAAAKGGGYASNLATERAKNQQFAQDNPWTNAVGGIAATAPLVAAGGPAFGLTGLGGRVAASAGPAALAGALQGASSSPDLTNVSDAAGRAGLGAAEGGALGAAVPLAGAAVSPIAAGLRPGPGAADIAKLGGDVMAAYQNVKDLGAAYSPVAYQGLVSKIGQTAKDAYMDPALTPGAASVINNMQGRVGDQAMSLPELDKIRQLAWLRTGTSPSAEERMLGGGIRGSINDFIANAGPEQMAAGSGPDAAAAIQSARDLAMRKFKADALAQALDKAEIRASVTGSGGNIENATRQRLAALLDKEPWSPDELSQLNTMIRGTPVTNTLREFSRFGPKGNALTALLEIGGIGSGNPALMAAGGAGLAAQAGGALARRGAQKQLMATILAGGAAPATQALQIPSRAALAAALAARQQLPQQRNTGQ